MQWGSLVGFAVVFLLVALSVSATLAALLAIGAPWLRRLGPAAERRAAELAALVPVILAVTVVGVLALQAAAGADHCPVHGHHAHLCFRHGGAWLEVPWAVAILAAGAVVVLGRLVVLVATLARAGARVRALAAVSRRAGDVQLVDSPRPFCFVAGLRRPTIYASTAAYGGLSLDEREAMLAHERAHVRGRDVARRALLELLTIAAAPLVPGFLHGRWEAANERWRDANAAHAAGADAVARALVQMCRIGAVRVAGAAFGTGQDRGLGGRIEAVLDEAPTGERAASRLAMATLAMTATAAVTAAAVADPLHHALETLLG
jgi:Zn-dependent protease with chaperone function